MGNDIRDQYRIEKLGDGYRISLDSRTGYKDKLIVFPLQDVHSTKMVASVTPIVGEFNVDLRPRDLSPRGSRVHFDMMAGVRYGIALWIEGDVARCTINGEEVMIENDHAFHGFYAFNVTKQVSFQLPKLTFKPLNVAGGG